MLYPRAHGDAGRRSWTAQTGPSSRDPPARRSTADEYGRVKVQFHYGTGSAEGRQDVVLDAREPAVSGTGYGGIVIPRIGNRYDRELEGDSDRRGRATGTTARRCSVTRCRATRRARRSRRTPSPGGKWFQMSCASSDAAGSEEVFQMRRRTGTSRSRTTARRASATTIRNTVGHDEKMEVKNDRIAEGRRERVGVDVVGNETIKIGGDLTRRWAARSA